MKPINKMLVGVDEAGELDIIETDEEEEGMFLLEGKPTISTITEPNYCPSCRKLVRVHEDRSIGLRTCAEPRAGGSLACGHNLKVITKIQLRELIGL